MLSINTNLSSEKLFRQMANTVRDINQASTRIATGVKLNKSADGPSQVVMSTMMRSNVVGLQQAISNLERTSSLLNTADSGLADVSSRLLEARDVILDAANSGTHDAESLNSLQQEIADILTAIDNVAASTKFGSVNLLDGSIGPTAIISDVSTTSFTTQVNKISGVSATTSLGQSSTTQAISKAVNNSGLSSTTSLSATHNRTTSNMWRSLTKPSDAAPGTVTFDLGSSYEIDRIAVWNYNGSSSTTVGVKDLTVSTSTDGVNYTALAGGPTQFARASGSTALAPQTFTFNATAARYVKFTITSNHGSTRVGLSEVAFGYSQQIPVASSSPERIASVAFTGSSYSAADDLDVTVNAAAEKAVVVTGTGSTETTTGEAVGTEQTGALAQSETLTLNGVDISLAAGLTRDQVIARINEFTTQTGVVADNPSGNVTRLTSTNYGNAAAISVVSTRAASSTSSGFGTTETVVNGIDIVGTIGGVAATGIGRVLTGAAGTSAAGVAITIDETSSGLSTYTGPVGTVSLDLRSNSFTTSSNTDTAAVNLGNVATSALGTAAAGASGGSNRFSNLREIDVTTAANAADSLAIVDAAIAQVAVIRGEIGARLAGTFAAAKSMNVASLLQEQSANATIEDADLASETRQLAAQLARSPLQQDLVRASRNVAESAANLLNVARLTSAENGFAPIWDRGAAADALER